MENRYNLYRGVIKREDLNRAAIDASGCTISLDELRQMAEDAADETPPKEKLLQALEKGPLFRK